MITQFDMTTGDMIETDHQQQARHPQGAEQRAALRLMTVAEAAEIEVVRTTLSPDSATPRFPLWLIKPA